MKPLSESPRIYRRFLIALLLIVGVQLWLIASTDVQLRRGQPTLIAIVAIIAMIRPLARFFAHLLDHVAHPSPRSARIIAVAIFITSSAFLYFQAIYQKQDFGPKYQD